MTHYPPDKDRGEIMQAHEEADVSIRWSVMEDGRLVHQSALKGDMLRLEYDAEDDHWTLDVRLPYPVDVTLSDADKHERVYEVVKALAEGKEVTIEGEESNGGEKA